MMEQLVGQSLGRYRLDALLGKGDMGAIFKARDITLQRDVAIKVVHPQFARRPDFQERFLQEARIAAQLKHPSIVQVFDFGQQRSLLYIVTQFIPGDNLRKLLQDLKAQGKWLPLDEAVQLVRQVCLALDYAHRQGVLHLGIKPGNIMLKAEPSEGLPYRPVITDLGLAKLREGSLTTQEGVSMDTPAYMSPEQVLGQLTDARSDVYSVGVLLYELAVGRPPLPVKTLSEAIRYHTQELPPPPRSLRPDLPELLERVILQALERDPEDRLSDASVLAQALEYIMPVVSEVAATPTALQSTVSLVTVYLQSLVEARGPSIIDEFPEPPSDLTQDRIQFLAPDETIRSVTIKARGMSIGRDDDNDIILDDPKVSRHHARVEFDGVDYRVIDLGSTNGTFLGNVKLSPDVPGVWTPDQALRIGDAWLRLVRAQRPASGAVFRSGGSTVDRSQIHTSRGQGQVGIFMETARLAVEPGGSTTASILLLNQGPEVEHFEVSVERIPAEWVSSLPAVIQLMPGQQQEVTFTIQPPRSPQSRAGRYPITVRVTSQDDPDQFAEVRATLTVAAYSQFSSELHPQKIRAGDPARIRVRNQGNTQEAFTLRWQDRAGELAFEPPQILTVPPGQAAVVEFRAAPRQRRWIGGEKTHPFTAQVSLAKGESQTHSGEVVSKGLIPAWALPILLFMCVSLAAAAAFAYQRIQGRSVSATQTAQATRLIGAQIAAATQTAAAEIALTTDTDGDGLTDVEEGKLGTDATKADTDGDGLSDGDERSWGSNPHVVDTDGDTLSDGVEAHDEKYHTSPINPDTDGDGLPDNVDPDPGDLPTPTPIPTETPTPTSTPTDTPTPTLTPTLTPSLTPCKPPVGWQIYVVQQGDTLYSLAQRYNITADAIVRANCLTNYTLYVGQNLYLPPLPATPTSTPTLVPKPPAPPSNLAATAISADMIQLNWIDNSDNETEFIIEKSSDGITFTDYTTASEPNRTQMSDIQLEPATTHCYRVRAHNANGDSNPSSTACATTQSNGPPAALTDLTAQVISSTHILLTWTNNSRCDGYKVYESKDGGAFPTEPTSTVNQGNLDGADVNGVEAGSTYAYRIRAYNSFGDSPDSNTSNTVTVPASTSDTVTRFFNNTAYPVISLQIDGVEQFPAQPQGIPSGRIYQLELAAGSYIYQAATGFWSGGQRIKMYIYSGSFYQQNGVAGQVQFNDPTIAQVLTRFGTSGYYVGEYWSGTTINSAAFRFYSNGTYTFYREGVVQGTGTYSLISYPGNYLVTFQVMGHQNAHGLMDERTGYFYMQNGLGDWPTIQYSYDGK